MNLLQALSATAGTCCGVALVFNLAWGLNLLSTGLTILGLGLLAYVGWMLYG